MKSNKFLNKEQQTCIVDAIKQAELNTSGEIRVYVESVCKINVLDRAVYVFKELDMFKTKARNGVLIYIAYDSHKFAIIGDEGINKVVPENFWDDAKSAMGASFSSGDFPGGICKAIGMVAENLKHYFPYSDDDVNEQPDEISFGK